MRTQRKRGQEEVVDTTRYKDRERRPALYSWTTGYRTQYSSQNGQMYSISVGSRKENRGSDGGGDKLHDMKRGERELEINTQKVY